MNYNTNIWYIALILFSLTSCGYDQQSKLKNSESIKIDSFDSLNVDTSQNIKEKLEFSTSHLKKIIIRNENKIIDWNSELMNADSTDSISIQIDINQMKNRVIIQKERLRRLKSKID